MRILKRDPLLKLFNDMLVDYPSPSNISYLWNFGSLAGLCLGIQIVTGVILAMHYTPHIDLAFSSVEHIMRDVNSGWLIRYTHANGASIFFLILYLHMLRGLYYGSYQHPRQLTWFVGIIILLLTIMTGFMGYVLPWGQMSLWAATVITNLLSAVPYVGKDLVYWVWGGFSVDNATLNRFFSLHYLLPFVLTALAGVHLIALHETLSGNPLGVNSKVDMIPFHPYFTAKDIFGIVLLLLVFASLVFFQPNLLGEPDNYIQANPMSTPPHIVPDWYFLPFYTILRSIPNKLGGVICMGSAILIYLALPFLSTSKIRSAAFRPIFRKIYWIFVANILILGWIGGIPVQQPFILIGQIATALYFIILLILIPVVGLLENKLLAYRA